MNLNDAKRLAGLPDLEEDAVGIILGLEDAGGCCWVGAKAKLTIEAAGFPARQGENQFSLLEIIRAARSWAEARSKEEAS